MHPADACSPPIGRRRLLQAAACGFGGLALDALLGRLAAAAPNPLAARAPHFPARAKRVIFLFMQGGPSQLDLFDFKPRLERGHGQPVGVTVDQPGATAPPPGVGNYLALGPMAPIKPRGECGMTISDLLPHLAGVADDLCLLRAVQTDNNAHAIATLQCFTGATADARPSMGAWVSYGLGAENENLPSFLAIRPDADVRTYGSAFLPAAHQGTAIASLSADPKQPAIRHLLDPSVSRDAQRREIDFVQSLNRELLARNGADAQMEGVIQSFELAFRMQAETPKLADLSGESAATLEMYGINDPRTENSGRACLLARRFSEAGVRFVQVGFGGWDHHGNLRNELPKSCVAMDRPAAALVRDLKMRGLLDDTLVVWSGEFGRTPWSQDLSGAAPIEQHGREHQPESFCAWMAGGGVKGGLTYGETDEFGYKGVENRVHLHDLHATMLHLLGLDHTRLTYRYAGRDYRLTDVYGEVVKGILA